MPGVFAEKHRQRDETPARTDRARPVRDLRGTDTAGHDDVLQMRAEKESYWANVKRSAELVLSGASLPCLLRHLEAALLSVDRGHTALVPSVFASSPLSLISRPLWLHWVCLDNAE